MSYAPGQHARECIPEERRRTLGAVRSRGLDILSRPAPARVALETTLLVHGVPRERALGLARDLASAVRAGGAEPALVGVVGGRAIVGLNDAELRTLLDAPAGAVQKANTSNLGALLHRGAHAATTVSTTMELADAASVRVFATGAIGGVHPGLGQRLDISADLAALARFPVAVITSGVKTILDVSSTREALESLGVPAVGWKTDRFPAFYLREASEGLGVDARFDDEDDLARYVSRELARTGRAVVIANPVPASEAIEPASWAQMLERAQREVASSGGAAGRDVTPALLAALHRVSDGATLRANLALALDNAALAGRLAARMG